MLRRAAVVTGAGSGLGRAIASQLASDGFNLTLNDLPPENEVLKNGLSETEDLCRQLGADTPTGQSVCTRLNNMVYIY